MYFKSNDFTECLQLGKKGEDLVKKLKCNKFFLKNIPRFRERGLMDSSKQSHLHMM
jgi:hypothetical protein